MKRLNHLVLTVASAAALGMALPLQARESLAGVKTPQDTARLSSPRYLEEHPELLRMPSSGAEPSVLPRDRLAKLTENTALANSPRFQEEHPELRWVLPPGQQFIPATVSQRERLEKLTENTALANSPRFLEAHPELLRREPWFEVAPLK